MHVLLAYVVCPSSVINKVHNNTVELESVPGGHGLGGSKSRSFVVFLANRVYLDLARPLARRTSILPTGYRTVSTSFGGPGKAVGKPVVVRPSLRSLIGNKSGIESFLCALNCIVSWRRKFCQRPDSEKIIITTITTTRYDSTTAIVFL